MPYVLTETHFKNGDIRINKCFSLRFGKKANRARNANTTSINQQEINRLRAERHREDLIINNFSEGDVWATFTYPKSLKPQSFDDAHKLCMKFMAKLKKKYSDIAYFVCTDTNKNNTNPHHHVILSWRGATKKVTYANSDGEKCTSIVPMTGKDLLDMWKKHIGMTKSMSGGGKEREIYNLSNGDLLAYFNKRKPKSYSSEGKVTEYIEKKFAHSRNLEKPKVVKKIINNKAWRKQPTPRKGYYIDELRNDFDAVGFERQTYVLKKDCKDVKKKDARTKKNIFKRLHRGSGARNT